VIPKKTARLPAGFVMASMEIIKLKDSPQFIVSTCQSVDVYTQNKGNLFARLIFFILLNAAILLAQLICRSQ
jgi:hypothetical protein